MITESNDLARNTPMKTNGKLVAENKCAIVEIFKIQ